MEQSCAIVRSFVREEERRCHDGGRPIPAIVLTAEETEVLERWARRPTTAQALAQRARIILSCAAGTANEAIARRLHVTRQTVGRWRARFLAQQLDGLLDEPRPGAPRKISDADVERVITRTLESTPQDATHWSTRSMAKAAGLSQSAISRIWRAFALQPHRTETFKLSKDPLFIDKVGTSWACISISIPRQGARALRGREVPYTGAGPHPAGAAHAPRAGGTADA